MNAKTPREQSLMPVADARVPGAVNPYAGRGVETSEVWAAQNFDYREYLRVVMKRRYLILSILALSVGYSALVGLTTTPLYISTVRIQIDRNAAKVVEGGSVSSGDSNDTDFQRTQYELLQSRTIALRAAAALNLGEDTDFFKPRDVTWRSALGSLLAMFQKPAPVAASSDTASKVESSVKQRWAAGVIMGNRAIKPVPGTRLVDISYSDPNGARAQRIAMALADAYIASNIDKRFVANADAKKFLEDQLDQLKARLEESERTLLDFAEKEQIVIVTEKSGAAESDLSTAMATLGAMATERIKNEQLWKQVETIDAINLPQFLTNAVIAGLRAQRNALVTEYQEKLETFKPGYPAMVQISNKIKEVDRQLAKEVQTIKDSLKAAYEGSRGQEEELKARVDSLRAEVLDLQKRSIRYNSLKREADTNRSLYNNLLQRYKEVDVASGVGANNVFVIDRAEVPGGPSSPQISRSLMLALGFGLALGIAAAFALEQLDDTIRSPEEVDRIPGLTPLGIIPKVGDLRPLEEEFADARSAVSESYRSLCTSLQFTSDTGLPKSLLVTSSGPSEGKSVSSIAIARHFAGIGMKVLLVDTDLRNPSLHKKLKLANSIGLSNYLTGACSPPDAFQATDLPNLVFMSSGPLPPNAADLLSSARLVSLLTVGLEVFDFIVLDGPPVMGLADAPLLSSAAAATVFVVGAGQARAGVVRGALRRLQMARANVIGSLVTKFDAKSAGYGYGYGYAYGSTYGYGGYSYGSQNAVQPDKVQPKLPGTRDAA
jgi:polysaccharide biosynthesis transport protein